MGQLITKPTTLTIERVCDNAEILDTPTGPCTLMPGDVVARDDAGRLVGIRRSDLARDFLPLDAETAALFEWPPTTPPASPAAAVLPVLLVDASCDPMALAEALQANANATSPLPIRPRPVVCAGCSSGAADGAEVWQHVHRDERYCPACAERINRATAADVIVKLPGLVMTPTELCARTACRRPGAICTHRHDGRRYCVPCARLINQHNPGPVPLVSIPAVEEGRRRAA